MLRDHVFHDATRSFCSKCHQLCDAMIIIKNGSAYLRKTCLTHGEELEVFEEYASYLFEKTRFDKPGNTIKPDTRVARGCPHDCGLCPDHEQHTCIGLIAPLERRAGPQLRAWGTCLLRGGDPAAASAARLLPCADAAVVTTANAPT